RIWIPLQDSLNQDGRNRFHLYHFLAKHFADYANAGFSQVLAQYPVFAFSHGGKIAKPSAQKKGVLTLNVLTRLAISGQFIPFPVHFLPIFAWCSFYNPPFIFRSSSIHLPLNNGG